MSTGEWIALDCRSHVTDLCAQSRTYIDIVFFDIGASAILLGLYPRTHRQPMSNPNSPSPRPTLKLKVAPRVTGPKKREELQSTAPAKLKSGAHWSDEYKERMQADMDALSSR